MKKLIFLLGCFCFALQALAQVPQSLNFGATAFDENNDLVISQTITLQISIRENTSNGTDIYSENHTTTTSEYGTFNINVGEGTAILGNFTDIVWNEIPKFYNVAIDVSGGTDFKEVGTFQILSVPYALTANKALNDADTDPLNEIQTLKQVLEQSNDANSLTIKNVADPAENQDVSTKNYVDEKINNIDINDADNNPNNEIQDISLEGTNLTITTGSTIDLSSLSGTDAQTLSLDGNNLSISNGNTVTVDTNPTNEIQNLALSGDLLTLDFSNNDVDLSQYRNTDNQQLSIEGKNITIENGNTITLDVDDADADSNNEIQDISLNGTDLSISNGSTIDLSSLLGTDAQTLSINGNDLSISNGNSVTIDIDSGNELNSNITLNGTSLEITDAGGTISTDLSSIQDGVDDADNDASNELQTLSIENETLTLSNGGGSVDLPFAWNINNNDLYTLNKVGIGTSTPGLPLSITGSAGITTSDENQEIVGMSVTANKNSSNNHAILATASYSGANSNKAIIATASGADQNYAIYAEASGGTTNVAGLFAGDVKVLGELNINHSFSFPSEDGASGQILTTDGNGLLSWSDNTSTDNQQLSLSGDILSLTNGGSVDLSDIGGSISTNLNQFDHLTVNYTNSITPPFSGGNLYLGFESGNTGFNNTIIGYKAGPGNTGFQNTFIGYLAGNANTSGTINTFVGSAAGYSNTIGQANTLIGNSSGSAISSGSNNTIIGHNAGSAITTGSGNILIGYEAGKNVTGSNQLVIHNENSTTPLIQGQFDTAEVKVNGSLEATNALIVPRLSSDPSNPVEGQQYFNTSTKKFRGYDGTQWVDLH